MGISKVNPRSRTSVKLILMSLTCAILDIPSVYLVVVTVLGLPFIVYLGKKMVERRDLRLATRLMVGSCSDPVQGKGCGSYSFKRLHPRIGFALSADDRF